MTSVLLRGGTIVRASGIETADVLIQDGKITSIEKQGTSNKKQGNTSISDSMDVTGKLLFPGLIDCHVHFREPGLTQKGDMQSESRAAIAGGVTTVCEMPNTVPPTVTVEALAEKVRIAHRIKDCDIRFFFGVTEAHHLIALRDIWIRPDAELQRLKQRCVGVKVYFDHSTGDQKLEEHLFDDLFALCGELAIPLVAHCEDAEMNNTANMAVQSHADVTEHSRIRSPASEAASLQRAIALARKHGTKLHIAHLSTKEGIDLVRAAKGERLAVTSEVAPHHLFLTVDDYRTLGTLAKMNPPLRTAEHRDALWGGIADGTVDCIATDHAPHTLKEKRAGNPLFAPSGVPGVETMLPLLLSASSNHWPHPTTLQPTTYNLQPSAIATLCFENPNRIFNLGKRGIVEDAPADIVMVDPKKQWVVRGKHLHSKCGWTPYEGWSILGTVEKVMCKP